MARLCLLPPRRNQQVTQRKSLCAAAVAIALVSGSAFATNGYFAHGYGTKNKGMAGAGVALPQDAMAAATNPAGMVHVGDRMDVGIELFSPRRTATLPPNFFGPGYPGATADSEEELFLIPHFAYNKMLDDSRAIGIAVYGNGGMNTTYRAADIMAPGDLGVDLMQLFITPTYSMKVSDKTSIGVSAMIAAQRFAAHVGGPNSNFDYSYGIGARLGLLTQVTDSITFGAALTSRTYMSEFDDYNWLFAEQGDFDIPANATIGVAIKANAKTTIAADVQHIWYSQVDAIANDMTAPESGFGWDDMTIVKLGAEYAYSNDLTLRAGISHGKQPISSSQTAQNWLAPATIETHITIGGTKKLDKDSELSFAAMYAPKKSITGTGMSTGANIEMSQFDLEVSYGTTW